MNEDIKIGTCGFGRTKRPEYAKVLTTVEMRYTYGDDELMELAALMPKERLSYVLFNNITMKDDAVRFRKLLNGISTDA